jgi:type IV secretory pathway VirB6-like protein
VLGVRCFGWFGSKTKVGSSERDLFDNNSDYYEGLDIVFESVNIFTTAMLDAVQSFKTFVPKTEKESSEKEKEARSGFLDGINMAQMVTVGVIGAILTGAVMLYLTGGVLLLLNHVFLVILLVLGPIFIALAAFKTTRDYAKKWLVKLVTVGLTLALVLGVLGFVLKMQGSVSGQLCRVAIELRTQMAKHVDGSSGSSEMSAEQEKIKNVLIARLDNLANLANPLSANGTLARNIKKGCIAGAGGSSSGSESNLMFVAMQYLVLCMIFSRLITEMANLASSIIGASGMNGSASEISGSLQGTMNRGVAKGGKGIAANGGKNSV